MDKAALLKGYLPEDDVELPSGQGTVRVRGLSRIEATAVQRAYQKEDVDAAEGVILASGMLDPTLTEDEAQQWRAGAAAGDIEAVTQRISELSKLDDAGGKGPTSRSRRTRN